MFYTKLHWWLIYLKQEERWRLCFMAFIIWYFFLFLYSIEARMEYSFISHNPLKLYNLYNQPSAFPHELSSYFQQIKQSCREKGYFPVYNEFVLNVFFPPNHRCIGLFFKFDRKYRYLFVPRPKLTYLFRMYSIRAWITRQWPIAFWSTSGRNLCILFFLWGRGVCLHIGPP